MGINGQNSPLVKTKKNCYSRIKTNMAKLLNGGW